MALTKQKKDEVVDDVKQIVENAESIVFVNFHGLTNADTQAVRRGLRAEGVNYRVAKKTLIRRVLDGNNIEGEMPLLEGELALAYGDDPVAPAREVNTFVKQHKEELAIVGGVFQGVYKNKDEMMSIATIPSMHVLHAQFVNLINTPIQQFVMALDQIAQTKS